MRMSMDTALKTKRKYAKLQVLGYLGSKELLENPEGIPLNCITYVRKIILGIETAYKTISRSHNGEYKVKLIEDVF